MARIILLAEIADLCESTQMEELLTFVRQGVQARKGRWPELAKVSGVSYSWLTKFGSNKYEETNIGHRTLEKLAAALREMPQ